jgi:5-methylcytosine-specific restriction enzyme subunit McrC
MTVVELSAWDELVVELSAEQAAAIEREELANVLAGPSPGIWRVKTGAKVGVVVGEDWEVRVSPKLQVPHLMFLLAYAADQQGWRKIVAGFQAEADLFAAIASGFSWHATWAIDRNLLRSYVHRDERRVDIRGRIRFGDQLARGGGLPLPVEVSYDDFTEDVLENRMLKTAALLLLRLPRVPAAARGRLHRLRSVLEGVEPLSDWRGVPAPPITRLNQIYEPALRLAELILAAASLGEKAGHIRSTTFVFDMNKIFEDFVTAAFRESMRSHGGVVRDQDKAHSLDNARRLKLKPDLSWWTGSSCLAVLDAKYKAIDDGLMRHDDAYQMLAYCVAYGLPRGYLVYAKDTGQESHVHEVRNLPVDIVVSALDVGAEPEALLAQVEALADEVAAGSRKPPLALAS